MARIYVAHKYEGDKENIKKLGVILRQLQKEHPENSYFSPLHNFSYLEYDDMPMCFLKAYRLERGYICGPWDYWRGIDLKYF